MPFISKEQKENIMSLTAFVIVPFKVFTDFPAENMMHSFLKFCRFSGPEIGRKEKLNSFYANEEHYKPLRILMLIICLSHQLFVTSSLYLGIGTSRKPSLTTNATA